MNDRADDEDLRDGLFWVRAGTGWASATPSECADEIARLREALRQIAAPVERRARMTEKQTPRGWWCEVCQDGTTPATHLVRHGVAHRLGKPGLVPDASGDDFYCERCLYGVANLRRAMRRG
jgi:hypothetical protein